MATSTAAPVPVTVEDTSSKRKPSIFTKLARSLSKPVAEEEAPTAAKEVGWSPYRQKIRSVGKLSILFRTNLNTDQVFASFLPRMLHQQLLDYSLPGQGLQLEFKGAGRSVEAAVMFSDASGFTAVSAAADAPAARLHARASPRPAPLSPMNKIILTQ